MRTMIISADGFKLPVCAHTDAIPATKQRNSNQQVCCRTAIYEVSLSRFMDFEPRVLHQKPLPTMVRRAFGVGYSSPKHHDRSGEDACLLHYAQMSEQS